MNPFTFPLDVQRQLTTQANDALESAMALPEQTERINTVEVGQTPSEVIYEENKLQLLRYEPVVPEAQREPVPILIVYALINQPYILDLQPDRSVVRRLLEAGFEVYLIDWGEPSTLDASLSLDDYVNRYIDNCVDAVCEDAGVPTLNLLGYCMGGTMSVMYTALHQQKVNSLGLMAAGLCFEGTGGVLETWGDEQYYDPGKLVDTFGNVPAEFLDVGFALMDPVDNYVSKYIQLYENLDDDDFVENFARMERWLSEGIDVAGVAYQEFLEEIYQENSLYHNDLYIGDDHVDITEISVPLLQVVGEYDHLIPPEASKPFNEVVGSDDTTTIEAATGHIGLSVSSSSHETLWPDVAAWFSSQSTPGHTDTEESVAEALMTVDGIGETYAARLQDAGIETLAALSEADPIAVANAASVSLAKAEDWVEQAST